MADSIQQIITNIANSLGVAPNLAVAIAQQESGLNPNAIGDNGNSVGLFQLNDNGEGAGLTVAQREDPTTNATIALKEVAAVAAQHPNWTPGQIAAAAQRPADPGTYANDVNKLLGNSASTPPGTSGAATGGASAGDASGTAGGAAAGSTGAAGGAAGSTSGSGSGSTVTVELGPNTTKQAATLADASNSLGKGLSGIAGFVNKLQWFTLPTTWTRILCGIVGIVLLWIGLHHLAQEIKS
jgi:Transglycosylase SLT domain